MRNFLILIPSLDPDEKIISVVSGLKEVGFTEFLIVNDGSASSYYFERLQNEFNCVVINHSINKGKGVALKTGYKYCKNREDISYILTVDGDNQHKAKDVLAVAKTLSESDEKALVLGVRNFNKRKNIPLRSFIGNQISACVLALMLGKKLQDTQTGLRGFHINAIDDMLEINGERFEYETNVLLYARKKGLKLIETSIETVYIQENESSHFNPLGDSLKVFSVIGKFFLSSCISFIVDISVFSVIIYLFFKGNDTTADVFIASVIARVISSAVNFVLNYKTVFKSDENLKVAIVKYYGFAIILMLISSFTTSFFGEMTQLPVITKIIVDAILFMCSYWIQKYYIFNRKGQIND